MIFTVHHTCKKHKGKIINVEEIPFISLYDKEKNKFPFLGTGYYFWDYNEHSSHFWGERHYSNSYYIFEADVNIDESKDGYFLDLVGNRKHLVYFVELLNKLNLIHPEGTKGIDLCYIIEYLRKLDDEDIFPFKVIRAIDYISDSITGIKIAFSEGKKSYTFLNPRFIICFKNREDIVYIKKPFIKFAS